ncbi:MAG: SGNH/GDSL hydrolase family protein [Proteobacteria bacterium]|nr:SGNH/GDSL hydrolase family protein [Pseudomonadota bacterium]
MKRLISVMAATVFLIAFTCGSVMAGKNRNHQNRPVYYLSLGTSLAAGVQADPETGESVMTDISYPGILAQMIDQDIPKLRHRNLGCPSETSETLIYGGICDYDEGSQLDQALQFLHSHGKFTGLITIDLGANDILQCVNGVDIDQDCLDVTLFQLSENLSYILATLREAAPGTPIVGMTYYNPLSVYWFQNPAIAHYTVGLQLWINTVLESVYASYDIPVADVAGAFMSYDLITDENSNALPDSIELLCDWTWMCSHQNIHANELGYTVIAEEFYAILPDISISEPPYKNWQERRRGSNSPIEKKAKHSYHKWPR